MHDSASGIRPSPNVEQGSTYKKTFIGEPSLSEGSGNRGAVNWDVAVLAQLVLRPELPAGQQAGRRWPRVGVATAPRSRGGRWSALVQSPQAAQEAQVSEDTARPPPTEAGG